MPEELVSDMYPPNRLQDQKARENAKLRSGAEKPEPKPKNEPVVESVVVQRKKGFWKRSRDFVQSEDVSAIGSYLVHDVAVPAIQNLIYDMIDNGAERLLFGTGGRSPRRRTTLDRRPNYVNYSGRSTLERGRENTSRDISSAARRTHDFGEIILASRAEADAVLDTLSGLINQYGQATVLDLYELVNIDANFTDDKWGWTQLRTAGVVHVRDGYLLDLPRTESLS